MNERIWEFNPSIDIPSQAKGIDLATFNKQECIDYFKSKVTITGYNVLLLLYKRLTEKVTKGGVILADVSIERQEQDHKYGSYTGLVLQIGPDAFQGKNFPNGTNVNVGDWVVFPRAASMQLAYEYNDSDIIIIEDYKIKMVVQEPDKITK